MLEKTTADRIPRDPKDDYTPEIVEKRRRFVEERTGTTLAHTSGFSIDPGAARGNCENFTGVTQVPMGFAGPMRVNGDDATGDFYVPMATVEGTLLASYGRGMRVTRMAGGVNVTVVNDLMQRTPVFAFDDAKAARAFGRWIAEHFAEIKTVADGTSSVGRLVDIVQIAAAKLLYLRFNYTTGDAAGQNMTSKATWIACQWVMERYEGIRAFTLSGNMDTDKKASHINALHTRGKRVIAECVISDEILRTQLHVGGRQLFESRQRATLGAWMSGSVNNGSHSANALAAVFIATGQDAANVAESHTGAVYTELLPNDDYYFSITIPSLIVATYGGGTGLPTQREALDVLDCYGSGKVRKFAEIVAATVLCGELSLGAAVVAGHWVDAHDRLGRNRP